MHYFIILGLIRWGGVGWGASNVLLLHPHRRGFSRMRSYVMGWGGVGLMTSCVCIRTDTSSYGIKDTSCYGCYVGCTSARYGCYVGCTSACHGCHVDGDMSHQNLVKIRLVYSHFAEGKQMHFCKR